MNKAIISIRLEVDGTWYTLPTFESSSIQITKKVSNVEELFEQSTMTEQDFMIDNSPEFIEAVGDLSQFGTKTKVNINQAINGTIEIDNRTAFIGKFQVLGVQLNPETHLDQVKLLFRANETSLRSELETLKLTSVLDGFIIPYTYAQIATSFTVGSLQTRWRTDGYTFTLVDRGQRFGINGNGLIDVQDTLNPQINIQHFHPIVTIEKILSLCNLNIEWDSSIDDLIKDQGILLLIEDRLSPKLVRSNKYYAGYMSRTSSINLGFGSWTPVNFNNSTMLGSGTNRWNLIGETYTAAVDGWHSFRFSGDIDVSFASFGVYYGQVLFRIELDGTPVTGTTGAKGFNMIAGTTNLNYNFSYNVYMKAGQNVVPNYFVNQNASFGATGLTVTQTTDFYFECVTSPSITSTSEVDAGQNVDTGLTAWDVVKSVLIQCNAVVELSGNNGYKITPFVTWINSSTKVLDLNKILATDADIEIEPFGSFGPKQIKLSYAEDDDLYSRKFREFVGRSYGSFELLDTGTDLGDDTFEIELPFALTPITGLEGNPNGIIPKIYDEDYKPVKLKPRLMQLQVFVPYDIEMQDLFSSSTQTVKPPNVHHWELISPGYSQYSYAFQKTPNFSFASGFPDLNLYKRFWQTYVEEMFSRNSRIVKCNIILTAFEFAKLKLNEEVIFRNQKFRIVKIEDYDVSGNGSVRVELVQRLIIDNADIAPFYPTGVSNFGVVSWSRSSDEVALGETPTPAADHEESAAAYGFEYDSDKNKSYERAIILEL